MNLVHAVHAKGPCLIPSTTAQEAISKTSLEQLLNMANSPTPTSRNNKLTQ